jgi:mevalonate kinase
MEKTKYYSNGKLLLTGEYLILDGAKGLAVPSQYGQSLEVTPTETETIYWTGIDADGCIWYEDELSFETIINKTITRETGDTRSTLIELLHFCSLNNTAFLSQGKGYKLTTRLTFPRKWGLGTSSTLVNNLAQWLDVNPYRLLAETFGGSGYDIACAQHNQPILFHLKNEIAQVENIVFDPLFKDSLYFIYLNHKQSSKTAIQSYMNHRGRIDKIIPKINLLTKQFLRATSLDEFSNVMLEHEAIMSEVLEMKTVQEALFMDFKGTLKSLGAWGGDFILCASDTPPHDYFFKKGYETIISYHDMVIK